MCPTGDRSLLSHEGIDELETTPCLLCGSTSSHVLYTLPDLLLGFPGSFTLVRCGDCNLVYQNPRPSPSEIGFYYPPEYDPFIAPPWANPDRVTQLVHLYGLKKRWRLVEKWAPRRSNQRTILDIGCATGVFLAAGSDDWLKIGVELTAEAAAFARQQFGLTVHQGMLEQAPVEAKSFDVVTMWDVLEHVHDPRRTLSYIHYLLRPDGILIVRVPNLDSWDAALSGRYWAGLDQPRHLFVPDEATLTHLLQQAGFVIVEYLCLSGTYGVLTLSWRFFLRHWVHNERQRRIAQSVLNNLGTRLLLSPLLWIVDKLFRKGSLLTVVAKPVN